jgi:hypothetical protein
MRRLRLVLPVLLAAALIPGVVAAQSGGGGLVQSLFSPFRAMAETLIDVLVDVLTTTSKIQPNPPVELIHRLTLVVALASSALVLIAAGIYYITGTYLGVTYRQVRLILPRLIIALAFATVSLPLLQMGVELSNALVEAFRPADSLSVQELAGLSSGLVLVWFINAWLLLALVLLFVFRNVYLLFVAAVSPLIALGWSFPNTRPYAESFIAGWFTLLAVAPIDVLVLRFNLALMEGSEALGFESVSEWILGVASFTLMLWIPRQLYSVSQSLVGRSTGVSRSAGASWNEKGPGGGSGGSSGDELTREERRRLRRNQRRRDRER